MLLRMRPGESGEPGREHLTAIPSPSLRFVSPKHPSPPSLRFVSPKRPSPPLLGFVPPKRLQPARCRRRGTRNNRTVRPRRGAALQGPSRSLLRRHDTLFLFRDRQQALGIAGNAGANALMRGENRRRSSPRKRGSSQATAVLLTLGPRFRGDERRRECRALSTVMAGLVPAIHVLLS